MVTKQEVIQEGIANRLWRRASLPSINIEWEELTPFAKECWLHLAENEMAILDSQGVAIKAEGKLPNKLHKPGFFSIGKYQACEDTQFQMLAAGFTAWEPLKRSRW